MLMAGSIICLALPRDWLLPAREMTQLIALPQYAVNRAADRATDPVQTVRRRTVPADEHARLTERLQNLENELATLRLQGIQQEAMLEELTGVRHLPGFPADGLLIPASVVAPDAAPGRESLLVSKGRRHKVQPGDWVTSWLDVTAGAADGVHRDLAVLARQTLIGWVEQVSSHTSRVVLLSDPAANKAWRVHVAQADTCQFVADLKDHRKPADFALRGIGRGQMRIADIDARFVDSKTIRLGDLVTWDERDPRLPLALVIGEITDLRQDPQQPLLYEATLRHRHDPKQLDQVLIVDLSR